MLEPWQSHFIFLLSTTQSTINSDESKDVAANSACFLCCFFICWLQQARKDARLSTTTQKMVVASGVCVNLTSADISENKSYCDVLLNET